MNLDTTSTHEIPPSTQKLQEISSGINKLQDKIKDSPKVVVSIASNRSFVFDDYGEQQNALNENAQNPRGGRAKSFKNLAHATLFTNKIKKKEAVEPTIDIPLQVSLKFKKFARENYSLVTEDMLLRTVSLENEKDSRLITDILKKKSSKRCNNEISFLQKGLRNLKFFMQIENEIDKATFKELVQRLTIERFAPGQKICSIGAIAKKFYVFLKGSAYVLLKKNGILGKEKNLKQDRDRDLTSEKLEQILQGSISEAQKQVEVENCYPKLWIAKALSRGESFGEIGLQQAGEGVRTATVVSSEETLLGVLTYDDYQATIAKFYESQCKETTSFFVPIDAFGHWPRSQIASLACQVEELKVIRNDVLVKQDKIMENLYFLKSGEVELQKTYNPLEDDSSRVIHTASDETDKYSRNHPFKKKKGEIIKLGKILTGDYFGITSSHEHQSATFTAIVTSAEATLVLIPKNKFHRLIKDKKTLCVLNEHMTLRDVWHGEMTSNYIHINNEYSNTARMSPSVATNDYGISTAKRSQTETSPQLATHQFSEFRRFKKSSHEIRPEGAITQQPKVIRKVSELPPTNDPLELIEQYRHFRNNITSKATVTRIKIASDNRSIRKRLFTAKHSKHETTASSEAPLDPRSMNNTPEQRKMSLTVRNNVKHKTITGYPSFPVLNSQYLRGDRADTPTSDKLSNCSVTPGIKISTIGKSWHIDQLIEPYKSPFKGSRSVDKKSTSSFSLRVPINNL